MYRCLFGLCLNLAHNTTQQEGVVRCLRRPAISLAHLPPLTSPSITLSTMSSTFTYLLIPADTSLPVQKLTASKAGGLSDDELQKEAKQYFFERSDKKAMQGELLMCRYC